MVNINLAGDLGKYAVQSPLASSGLKVNVGGEYRDQTSAFLTDAFAQSGNADGNGGANPSIIGGEISRIRSGLVGTYIDRYIDELIAHNPSSATASDCMGRPAVLLTPALEFRYSAGATPCAPPGRRRGTGSTSLWLGVILPG
ncbi:MAG: hypothetical protein ABI145_16115 [Steroidobacteraceae bacterium]